MTRAPHATTRAARVRGQAATESVIVAVLVAMLLFVGEPSLLERLLEAIRQAYAGFSHAIALP